MPIQPSVKTCTHIKVTGVRCGSPALRGEHFCYFHQRMVRGVRTPPQSRIHPIALLENEESIQASLMEVVNALVRNTVDIKRAELVLRALNAAIRNSRRVHFEAEQHHMVRQIPEYAAPPVPQPASKSAAQLATTPAPVDTFGFTSTPPGQPIASQHRVTSQDRAISKDRAAGEKAMPPQKPPQPARTESLPHPSRLPKAGISHTFPQRKPPSTIKPPESATPRKAAIAT